MFICLFFTYSFLKRQIILFLVDCCFAMFGSGTTSKFCEPNARPLRPRSKNASGNRTDIGWKHGTNVLGNGKKVKCNYCSKTFN